MRRKNSYQNSDGNDLTNHSHEDKKKCFGESLETAYEALRIDDVCFLDGEMDVWGYIKHYGYGDEVFLKCIFPLALEIFKLG